MVKGNRKSKEVHCFLVEDAMYTVDYKVMLNIEVVAEKNLRSLSHFWWGMAIDNEYTFKNQ